MRAREPSESAPSRPRPRTRASLSPSDPRARRARSPARLPRARPNLISRASSARARAQVDEPYSFLADAALKQVVAVAGPAHRMLTLLPMLVIPLQKLLRDDDPKIVSRVVELLQILVTCDAVEQGGMGLCGRALVASYNKLCPTLNALRESMPQFEPKVMETLELMEVHGGAGAYRKIKALIPTYTSAVAGVSVSKTAWQ